MSDTPARPPVYCVWEPPLLDDQTEAMIKDVEAQYDRAEATLVTVLTRYPTGIDLAELVFGYYSARADSALRAYRSKKH